MVDLKVVVGRCGLGGADKARFELSIERNTECMNKP